MSCSILNRHKQHSTKTTSDTQDDLGPHSLQNARKLILHWSIAPEKTKNTDIFLISPQTHMLWYSLEVPHWGASNEYPQHMFSWRNKEDIMWIPSLIRSYFGEAHVKLEWIQKMFNGTIQTLSHVIIRKGLLCYMWTVTPHISWGIHAINHSCREGTFLYQNIHQKEQIFFLFLLENLCCGNSPECISLLWLLTEALSMSTRNICFHREMRKKYLSVYASYLELCVWSGAKYLSNQKSKGHCRIHVQLTLWNTLRYPYLDISELRKK